MATVGIQRFDQQVDVSFGTAAIFCGNYVRTEKCGVNIERMLLMQFREQGEDFEFALPVEAVAAFGFDGGGAVRREFIQIGDGAFF